MHVVDHPVADGQLALSDFFEARDQAQGRRFAAARGTDEDHQLLVPDIEIEVLEDAHVAETLGYLVKTNTGHAQFLFSRRFGGRIS